MVYKVAIDAVGIYDNPAEYYNQKFLKPYCCKVFECSPCGTIASFEKVDNITTVEEFYTVADDYFYLLSRVILGKYVMSDIGIDYFMNIGIRRNFGIVLLDFPYLFELDGSKLTCQAQLDDGTICNGEIDYDAGFNNLICKNCGKVFMARDLSKNPESSRGVLLRTRGAKKMKISIMRGDKVVKTFNNEVTADYLRKPDNAGANKKKNTSLKVNVKKVPVVVKKNSSEVKNIISINNGTVKKAVKVVKPEKKVVTKSVKIEIGNGVNKSKELVKDIEESVNVNIRTIKLPPNKKKHVVVRNVGVSTVKKAVPTHKIKAEVKPVITKIVNISVKPGEGKTERINSMTGNSDVVVKVLRGDEKLEEVKLPGVETSSEHTINVSVNGNKPETDKVEKAEEPDVVEEKKEEPVKEEVIETTIEKLEEVKESENKEYEGPETPVQAVAFEETSPIFDEVAVTETHESEEEVESDEEEEESDEEDDGYDVRFCYDIPDEIEPEVIYAVPVDKNNKDISLLQDSKMSDIEALATGGEFILYYGMEDNKVGVMEYSEEEDQYIVVYNDDEDQEYSEEETESEDQQNDTEVDGTMVPKNWKVSLADVVNSGSEE